MTTVIVTDKITTFPRDQKGIMLRLHSNIRRKSWIGKTIHKQVTDIKDLYESIIQGRFPVCKRVYLGIGYVEPIKKKEQINLTVERLQYILEYFLEMDIQVCIFVPVIRVKLNKSQKLYFKSIHIFLNTFQNDNEITFLKSPLCGKNPHSPNIESINNFVLAIATNMQVRKVVPQNVVVEDNKKETSVIIESKQKPIPVTIVRSRGSVRKKVKTQNVSKPNKKIQTPQIKEKKEVVKPKPSFRISITDEAPKRKTRII